MYHSSCFIEYALYSIFVPLKFCLGRVLICSLNLCMAFFYYLVRTSMNLAGFQAIYFMDLPIQKTIDIFVHEMNLRMPHCLHSVCYDYHEEQPHNSKLSQSHPKFPCLMLGTPGTRIPLLTSMTKGLAFYDSGFPIEA